MKDNTYEDILKVASNVTLYNFLDGVTSERLTFSSQFSDDLTVTPLFYDAAPFKNYEWQYTTNITNYLSPYQDSSITRSGDFGLLDVGICWLTKNKMLSAIYGKAGSTTGDGGIAFGTMNISTTNTQKFKNATNLWTYKPADPAFYGGGEGAALVFDSNLSLECYGISPTQTYSITSTLYNNTDETWTSRTQDTGCGGEPGRVGPAGCSLTSDIGMAVGGYISMGAMPVSRQYQKSADAWSARTNYPIVNCDTPSASQTTDRFIISTGWQNASPNVMAYTYIYTYSTNSWTNKTNYPISVIYISAASLSAYRSLFSGGASYPTTRFYDNTIYRMEAGNYWASTYSQLISQIFASQTLSHSPTLSTFFGGTNGTYLDNTYQFISGNRYNWWDSISQTNFDCSLPISKRQDLVKTVNVTNTKNPIKNVMVVVSNFCDKSVDDTTIGLSLDGGKTWKDDLNPGKVLNTDGLSPDTDGYYKLKVKVNTYNSMIKNTDVWSFKTEPSVVRASVGSLSLGTDYGLYIGGSIDPSVYNLVDRYNVSSNSFSSRTAFNQIPKAGISATSLNSDLGLAFGGCNNISAPIGYSHHERYSNSLNLWTSRASFPVAAWSIQPFTYNWDLVGGIGGWNGGVYYTNYLYAHSYNVWQSKTGIPQGVTVAGYATLTHKEVLITGGLITETSAYYTGSQKFDLVANTWLAMATIIEGIEGGFSASLGSSRALYSGGTVYPRSGGSANWRYWSEEFSYVSNVWLLRKNTPNKFICSGCFSATSDSSFGICSTDIITPSHHMCYFSGHVDNTNLLVQVLD